MYNIKICKYYKHPKTCTNPNGCIEQLISNPQFCCSKLYYSMGLEEVNENYKQALDEIEKIVKQTCSQRCTNDCLGTRKHCGYGHILDIINQAKEG